MKRRRFIAGILVLSMLLMGTGYAYWTDKLSINTTAKTGEMKVKFVDLALYGQYAGGDQETGWSIIDGTGSDAEVGDYYFSSGSDRGATEAKVNSLGDAAKITTYRQLIDDYAKVTFDAYLKDNKAKLNTSAYGSAYTPNADIADSIQIDLTNLYPGYAQAFQADIVNLGTLTARLSSVVARADKTVGSEYDMLGIAMHVLREYAGGQNNGTVGGQQGHIDVLTDLASTSGLTLDESNTFELGGVRFLRLSALPYLNETLSNSEIFVHPDDNRMDVYFAVAMDPDAEGDFTTGSVNGSVISPNVKNDADTQNKTAYVTIEFLWDQFNEGDVIDAADTNRLLKNITVAPAY